MPQQPAPQQPVYVNQNQNQQQQQVPFVQPTNTSYNDQSSSNSTSEANNSVEQIGTLQAVQNNFGNLNYVQLKNGIRLPSQWSFNMATNYATNGEAIVTAAVTYTPQGKARKIAHAQANMDTLYQQAAVCTQLIKANIQLDYNVAPQYSFCQGFNRVAIAPPVVQPAPVVNRDAEFQQRINILQNKLHQLRMNKTTKQFDG